MISLLYEAACTPFHLAFGHGGEAIVVEVEPGTPVHRVADMGDPGCLDQPGACELDALVRPEPEAGVEQPLPVAEDHR